MNHTKLNETLTGMQSGLFATKDSIEEAVQYAYSVIDSGSAGSKTAMYTVIHVLMNTIAEEIKRITEENKDD
jgi:hypothetical protein